MKIKLTTLALVTSFFVTSTAIAEMDLGHMSSNFMQMESMIDKAENTKNNKKRKQYMHNHMSLMMQQMESMSDIMSKHHNMNDKEMNDTQAMHKRMDMMQTMMKHMMRQQNMMMDNMEMDD